MSANLDVTDLEIRVERIARRELLVGQGVNGLPSKYEWNDAHKTVTVTIKDFSYQVRYTVSMKMLRDDIARLKAEAQHDQA
jgi:UDP-2,3-diacylglucosamine pyrophosphatase LpxH